MNILLVYPEYPGNTFWSYRHALPFIGKRASLPSLSLLTVAAMLPKEWQVRYVDLNVRKLTNTEIMWADYVFISAMLVQQASVRDIVTRCNRLNTKVVAGGPAFATTVSFTGIDHVFIGEAEALIPAFLDDLARGNPSPRYVSNERPMLAKTPIPRWDVLDMRPYATAMVQYSRGCPFTCEFCDIPGLYGDRQRVKSAEQMVAEFQALYDAGWRGGVFIVDDNFIGNARNAEHMLPRIAEWQKRHGYPFTLLTEASINLGKMPKLLSLMRDANFSKVFLGIETPSKDALRECRKFQNIAFDVFEVVETIHRHGIQVMGGFIIGFDTDSDDIFETQVEFIQRAGIPSAMVGILTAVEGTRLWDRLSKEKRIVEQATGNNTDGGLNFIPKMDPARLRAGYQKVVSQLFSSGAYYRRVATLIDQYRPSVRTHLKWGDIRALFLSVFRIGICSRSRFHYWWLLARTALKKRKALPVAIELAIQHFHYQKVARAVARG